jgi:protein-disulfide isomerase/lipoprotein NlpI
MHTILGMKTSTVVLLLLLNTDTAALAQLDQTRHDPVRFRLQPHWQFLGSPKADLIMVEFNDYQCVYCSRFHRETFPFLKRKYIDKGQVRYLSGDLPLDFHPNAMEAAHAARCAGDQGKFWEMHNVLVSNPRHLRQIDIRGYARALSLDMAKFTSCTADKHYQKEIASDRELSKRIGIDGTPTFVIGRLSKGDFTGLVVSGAFPFEEFDRVIEKSLRSRSYVFLGGKDREVSDSSYDISRNPKNALAYVKRGTAYREKGDLKRAFADYAKAIRLDPGFGGAYAERGIAFRKSFQPSKAIADFDEAIRLFPEYGQAFEARGGVYLDAGDYDRAHADFSKVIELRPRSDVAFHNRGVVHFNKAQYRDAIADFDEAIKLDGRYGNSYLQRGKSFFALDNFERAIDDLDMLSV